MEEEGLSVVCASEEGKAEVLLVRGVVLVVSLGRCGLVEGEEEGEFLPLLSLELCVCGGGGGGVEGGGVEGGREEGGREGGRIERDTVNTCVSKAEPPYMYITNFLASKLL